MDFQQDKLLKQRVAMNQPRKQSIWQRIQKPSPIIPSTYSSAPLLPNLQNNQNHLTVPAGEDSPSATSGFLSFLGRRGTLSATPSFMSKKKEKKPQRLSLLMQLENDPNVENYVKHSDNSYKKKNPMPKKSTSESKRSESPQFSVIGNSDEDDTEALEEAEWPTPVSTTLNSSSQPKKKHPPPPPPSSIFNSQNNSFYQQNPNDSMYDDSLKRKMPGGRIAPAHAPIFRHNTTNSLAELCNLYDPNIDPNQNGFDLVNNGMLPPQLQRNLAEIEYDWLAAVVERLFFIIFCTFFFMMSFGINALGMYYWYFTTVDKIAHT